jgi:hypothetical protein
LIRGSLLTLKILEKQFFLSRVAKPDEETCEHEFHPDYCSRGYCSSETIHPSTVHPREHFSPKHLHRGCTSRVLFTIQTVHPSTVHLRILPSEYCSLRYCSSKHCSLPGTIIRALFMPSTVHPKEPCSSEDSSTRRTLSRGCFHLAHPFRKGPPFPPRTRRIRAYPSITYSREVNLIIKTLGVHGQG